MTDPERVSNPRLRGPGITLRELEVLHALIATGTAISAARSLGISQSAVSRRLAQLEGRLGFGLFQRAGGRLVATVEALSINEQLEPVFATLSRIAARTDGSPVTHRGTLSIAAPPTIAHRFLPAHVAAFSHSHPEMRIIFDVLASDALVTGVAECRYDLGLTDSAPAHDGIHSDLFLSTNAVCILPQTHRLLTKDAIRPEDLQDEAFVALSRRHSSRAAIDRMFDRAGVAPRLVIEAATSVSAMEFVRAGLGVALVNPFPVVERTGPGIGVRPFLPEIAFSTNFLTPSSRAPSAAMLDFVNSVRAGLDSDFDGPDHYRRQLKDMT